MKYYSAIKNEDILPFVTAYMEFKGIMLSEISPTETCRIHTRQILCDLTYVWNLQKKKKKTS